MTPLTPADVKRWDPEAIHGVFQTATNRATSLQTLGDNLQQVHLNLSEWHGDSGDAFRADLGKARHDIEADGHESKQVAAAVSQAEADVRAVKSELDGIEQSAHECGFTITSDWRIDTGGAKLENAKLLAQQQLQTVLDVCKLHAHSADQELAAAIRSAVGEGSVGVTPSPPGAGQPKTLQDMLLPAGPARPQTGGDPAKGPPVPGDAHGGATPSVEDMLLGRGEPAGAGGPSGDPLELLSRIPPGTRGVAPPPLKPAEIESFKAMARQTMINDGVPPDQIEARLDAVVGQTQQWLDAGAPNYVAPEGPRPPAPGFAEAFGDRWFASEQGVKNLLGQGGPGAPGVVESWTQMLKGTLETAQNPMGAAVDEFKHAVESPSLAYYLGEKSADVAFNAPAMMFGGEGAALKAGLGDMANVDVYAGMTHPPNLPIGLDNPTTYHSLAETAAQDLRSAFDHAEPSTTLSQHLSDMVTHYVGDSPDRVVLGKWDEQDGGYIGDARAHGGIFFDTGDPVWQTISQGLDKSAERDIVWPVNQQFLRTQMENQVPRIDYMLDTSKYRALEDMLLGDSGSYSAMEVKFLSQHAADYGYERIGNSWIYTGGGG